MSDRENPLAHWFGERKIVRLMLLAAILAVGVIHVESILSGVLFLWNVARPLITGAVIAYILEIIIKLLEKHLFPNSKNKWFIRSKRFLCILIAALLVLSILVLIFSIVIPGLADAFTLIGREFPSYFAQCKQWITENLENVPAVTDSIREFELDWPTLQGRVVDWAINGMGGQSLLSSTVSVISAVTGSIANFAISVIFAICLLVEKGKLQNQYRNVMSAAMDEKKNSILQHILTTANRCFAGFIVGQTVNGLIMGVLTWLGMRIIGMPYALIVGVISGTTALIPVIGGFIGAAIGTFLVFTANPSMAVWFLVFIIALQNIQGNLLYPRLVGNSVGIPSLWVLAAVSFGGGLGGIGGMMLAVPITATIYALTHEWVQKKKSLSKAPAQT